MLLRLDDGTTVTVLARPPQGLRHLVLLGVEEASGREVAVKVERLPGALAPERRALELLGTGNGPAPSLVRAAEVIAVEGDDDLAAEARGALCLVCERVAGESPRSVAGWGRLGRVLADLVSLPWEGSGLTVHAHAEFLAAHGRRVDDLGRALGSDLGARLPTVPASYADSPLVLTHGDPGPGNFLDDGAVGKLIDWEDAGVAPRGLDLGRAAFIALLGGGPQGYVVVEEEARSDAVVAGFRAASDDAFPDAEELRWWLAVAGVQFAHWRFERAGAPSIPPWRDAVDVLLSAA